MNRNTPKIQAAIFDMDGLLVDTEPFWQASELEVFPAVGVPLKREMCLETIGLRIDEVVEHWYLQYPWDGKTKEQVADEIVQGVAARIREKGRLLPGAAEAITQAHALGLRVGLASSSSKFLIQTVLDHFALREQFALFRSAEDEEYGKPHPAVFIRAALDLGVAPTACVAFEDSFNGLLAAKSARMRTIVVPEAHHAGQERWCIADVRLNSLLELQPAHWGL